MRKREYNKAHYEANKEHKKAYYEANKAKRKEQRKAHYEANKAKRKEQNKAYYEANKAKRKEQSKAHYEANKAKRKEQKKAYYEANKAKVLEQKNAYRKNRRKNDLAFKIRCNLRGRISGVIRGRGKKAGSAVRDMGCSGGELLKHLESGFYVRAKTGEKMTFDNYGMRGWHADHIIPISSFDLTDREQFLRASHYTNLQPLWAEDNMAKSDKMPESAEFLSTVFPLDSSEDPGYLPQHGTPFRKKAS